MGYLKRVGTFFIYVAVFFAILAFVPGIPPNIQFSEYSVVPSKAVNPGLAINDRLNSAERLFEGRLKGPECFDSYNGELYTGLHFGHVVKIVGDEIVPIVKFGKPCNGIWEESKCGRPLGLRFDKKGTLYVADAYYGIFKVDVKTGKYETVVDASEEIKGKRPRVFNSLDVASNGDIYWTDSSYNFGIEDGLFAILDNPTGRLIRYNAATKKNEVLLHDLVFANGIRLSSDESYLVVVESIASRIIRYNLKGPKANQAEVFIEGIPGVPDNIYHDGQGGFLVPLIDSSDAEHPQLIKSLIPHPNIRKVIVRLLTLIEKPFKMLDEVYPNEFLKKIVHGIGSFEYTPIFNDLVTILRIDANGKIIDAAYCTSGKIRGISATFIHDNYLWIGSPMAEYLARIPLKDAFPSLAVTAKKVKASESTAPAAPHTTAKPATTTPAPTTPKPTTTTPKPTTTTTPQPSTTTPKPTTTTPKPTTTTPQPSTTTPKPTTTKPITTTSKPTTTTTTPKPKTTTPAPATTSKPDTTTTTTTPKPRTTTPTTAKPSTTQLPKATTTTSKPADTTKPTSKTVKPAEAPETKSQTQKPDKVKSSTGTQ
ncbi:adipocyte plasma membrane-associated protein [Cephus cinctus]|uniref:Adipocyte plasma membrane-associated protein n=1 Tax=Cephus cinctus TaxID=211228 RepID=A0AAJ7FGR4_CEPCN|nr:adipocyte plasma membrane-associated protein [Cephus cinctus]